MTDEEYTELFQIAITPEMLGIKDKDQKTLDRVTNNAFAREVWNRAIERAADEAKNYLTGIGYRGIRTKEAVLKLKV